MVILKQLKDFCRIRQSALLNNIYQQTRTEKTARNERYCGSYLNTDKK